jgi:hypothetical protein
MYDYFSSCASLMADNLARMAPAATVSVADNLARMAAPPATGSVADHLATMAPAATLNTTDHRATMALAATVSAADRFAGMHPAATVIAADQFAGMGPAATLSAVDRLATMGPMSTTWLAAEQARPVPWLATEQIARPVIPLAAEEFHRTELYLDEFREPELTFRPTGLEMRLPDVTKMCTTNDLVRAIAREIASEVIKLLTNSTDDEPEAGET